MAYATGSGSSRDDLLDALASFATGLGTGWTATFTGGTGLVLENGIINATINYAIESINIYTGTSSSGSVSTGVNSNVLIGGLSTGITSPTTIWSSQPGANSYGEGIYCPDMDDIQGWYFFSGGTGDPNYIHVVVQTSSDRYEHFSIGMVQQNGLSHNGAAYMTSSNGRWWQDNYLDDNPTFNQPNHQGLAFLGGGEAGNRGQAQLLIGNALPTAGSWSSGVICRDETPCGVPGLANGMSSQFGCYSGGNAALLEAVCSSSPSTWSGFNVLWAMPVFAQNTNVPALLYVGDYPNVRACNMETLTPGQEITLVSDIWKVFPQIRQDTWNDSGIASECSSGQYALAYKKIT